MILDVKVDSRDLTDALSKAPLMINLRANAWVRRTTLRAEREAKLELEDNTDTGTLQNSVHSFFGNLTGRVTPTAKHAIFVNDGRRAGAKLPPFGERTSLGKWAKRKGIEPFVVARSIAKKGIDPDPFMENAYETIRPYAERESEKVLDQIVRSI